MKSAARNGYSLVELLVTLALVGVLAMVSLPYVRGGRGSAELESDARIIATRLRLARETALATRTESAVTISIVPPGVEGPGHVKSYHLRSVKRLRVISAKGEVGQGSAVILFEPDGSSSGGVVILDAGPQLRRISVDWLTGVVRVGKERS